MIYFFRNKAKGPGPIFCWYHMKKIFGLLLLSSPSLFGQYSFIAKVLDGETRQPLAGTSISLLKSGINGKADSSGLVTIHNISRGNQTIVFTCIGYKKVERVFIFPITILDTIEILLEPGAEELEEVLISSTRSNRSMNSTPTRVEVIAGDEIREEADMRPGDIKMLLSESTGIQAQQTSAISANTSIRIQGLDGRYTQILKDGFPIYSGAASGLGLLQIPPLDLRQVEIIKGAASTLYGGGAIAGLVNLLSKVPTEQRIFNFHINVTSAGGLDINSFYSKRFKKSGVTLFVSRNSNKAYDPSNISFSAIPKFERYTINPKLFLYFNDRTKLNFGFNTSFENRLGGDMKFIEGHGDSTHSYFERDISRRVTTQFTLDHQINKENSLTIKNSVGYFNRIIDSRGYEFDGKQYSTFTEATYVNKREKSDWVIGLNILTDRFEEKPLTLVELRNYDQTTFGVFVQNTLNTLNWLSLETGIRADYVIDYGFALLPRISALIKITPGLTSRIGGGFGYKPPTIFTEESERLLFKNVLPVNSDLNKLERSYGANWDVSYHTSVDKITFSINQFLFYTYLNNPLFLEPVPNDLYRLENIPGHIVSKGAETNIKIAYEDINLYLGYTYTDAEIRNNGITSENPLTPKHRLNMDLIYEVENKWKIGSEFYYFSKQLLSDGSIGRNYWLTGFLAERIWKNVSLFINFENIGDVRQTKFGDIYTGSITNPTFKDIYAPLEGFVVNGGIKLRL